MTAQRLVRVVAWTGWIACLGSIALAVALPSVASMPVIQWSPWLVGLFLLGIPHGAFDHRVGSELGVVEGQAAGPAAGPGFYAAYLAATIAVLGLWFVAPIVACGGFLAFAAAHFGQGDVYWSRRFGLAAHSNSLGYRVVLMLTRSLLPIALPLLAWPGVLTNASDLLAVRLFGRSSLSFLPSVTVGGLIVVGVVVGLQLGWAAWLGFRGDGPTYRAVMIELAETVLLVVTFAIVPPVLALGIYFNAWHSLRHVIRLIFIAGSTRDLIGSGHPLAAFGVFWKATLPMTCGALMILAGLGVVVASSLASVVDLGHLAIIALSALTLPHVLVVVWMDIRQGIWSPRPLRVR